MGKKFFLYMRKPNETSPFQISFHKEKREILIKRNKTIIKIIIQSEYCMLLLKLKRHFHDIKYTKKFHYLINTLLTILLK